METRCCLTRQHETSELSGSTSVPGSGSETPSNREKLTQATKALDGKRNPKRVSGLRARTRGTWLLRCLVRTMQLSPWQHLCPAHVAPSCFRHWDAARCPSCAREAVRTGHTRGHQGPMLAPHIPQCHHWSPAELQPLQKSPVRLSPASQGFPREPRGSCSQGSMPAGKKPIPAVWGNSDTAPKRQRESSRKCNAVCYPPSKRNSYLSTHH